MVVLLVRSPTHFIIASVPPAGVVANLTSMLATACSWYGDGLRVQSNEESHKTSLYNVPLLAARMMQDFGLGQTISDYTMALMGVENVSHGIADALGSDGDTNSFKKSRNSSADRKTTNGMSPKVFPPPLKCASPEKLYTPLHVAAVIVIACKLCPGWESLKITNFHAGANARKSDATKHSPSAFVPWNESQFQLLGNGPTLYHYLDFLEETAFRSLEPSTKVTQFFQSLEGEMKDHLSLNEDKPSAKPIAQPNKTQVTPNLILAGATNPNEPNPISNPSVFSSSQYVRYLAANNIGRYTSYQCRPHNGVKLSGHKPYHPHYCRLLEYICYIIEETNSEKLHKMVEEFEEELLASHRFYVSMSMSPESSECTNERVTICLKKGKYCKMCYRNQPGHLSPKMKLRLCKQSRKGCARCKETICDDCWDKGYDRHINWSKSN